MPLAGLAVFVVVVSALAWWLSHADDFWRRLAAGGFLLIPLSVVVQAASGNLTGVFGGPVPLVAASLVAGLVLAATKRFYFAAFVLAVFLTLVFLLFGLFGLTHPDSFGDFGPSVLSIAGALLAAVGSAKARGSRRGKTEATASTLQRNTVWAGAAVLALIAATSAVQTVVQPASSAAGAEVLRMSEDEFEPTVLRAKAGMRKTLFLDNDDAYAHTFTIDDADLDVYIGPLRGKRISLSLPADLLDDVEFVCTVTGHDEMRGRLEIER